MIKDYVCYGKNCWSTKHSIIDKAEKAEDEHIGEDLNKRITPQSHSQEPLLFSKRQYILKSFLNN